MACEYCDHIMTEGRCGNSACEARGLNRLEAYCAIERDPNVYKAISMAIDIRRERQKEYAVKSNEGEVK